MADTGLTRSPKVLKGCFVQLVRDIVGVVPNVIGFQFNPEKLGRSLTPWNPFELDPARRGAQAPNVQPFDPRETYSLSIELDASDPMADGNPIAVGFGIADRLAALKKLTLPTQGLLGDLAASAAALVGRGSAEAKRPTVPVVLFVFGPNRILPVRVTAFSVEETLFSPTLFPIQAKVTLGLEVLTPDVFKCQRDPTAEIAMAAYRFTRTQEDALALLNLANAPEAIRGLLPF